MRLMRGYLLASSPTVIGHARRVVDESGTTTHCGQEGVATTLWADRNISPVLWNILVVTGRAHFHMMVAAVLYAVCYTEYLGSTHAPSPRPTANLEALSRRP